MNVESLSIYLVEFFHQILYILDSYLSISFFSANVNVVFFIFKFQLLIAGDISKFISSIFSVNLTRSLSIFLIVSKNQLLIFSIGFLVLI